MAKFKSKDLLLKTGQKAYFGTSNESYISWDGSDLVLSGSDIRVKNDLFVEGLSASLLVSTDGSDKLVSVADLTNWIAGTTNQITVTDDTDGTVTLSLPATLNVNDINMGDLVVSGTSTLTGDVGAQGNVLIDDNLSVGGNTVLSGTLGVSGTSDFSGDVYLNNNTYFGANTISGTGDIYAGNFYGTFSGTIASGTVISGLDHSTLSNLDYDSAGHTGFVSIGTTQTITGAKTFSQTITTNNSQALLPTTSGAEDIGSSSLPYDEIYGKSFYGIGSATEGGSLVLGNSSSTAASYVTIYDGGAGNPAYIILYAGNGTAYYASVTDAGGFYLDTSVPSGAGIANIEFGASAITIQDNVIVDGLTANRLVSTNGSKQLTSVADLTSWVAGTANQITVTDDGDGTITLSLPTTLNVNDINMNNLVVSGTSTLVGDVGAQGNVLIDDNLSVGGNTVLSGTLDVTGATTLDGGLTVTGTSTFNSNIYFGNNIISGTGDIYCDQIFADIEDTNRRHGRVDCINGSNTVTGTFGGLGAFGDTDYSLVVSLEKDTGTPSQYAMTITNITTGGFVVEFSGDIDAADYDLHYIAIHD